MKQIGGAAGNRALVAAVALVAFSTSNAIVPEWQHVPKGVGKLDAVVRVTIGPGAGGTGSVIHKMDDPHDPNAFLLCVLTANHVIWDDGYYPNLKVGFFNEGAANAAEYSAWPVAEGRTKVIPIQGRDTSPDIALVGVKVPKTTFFQNLNPFVLDVNRAANTPFSVVGYGLTGDRLDKDGDGTFDGYLHDGQNPAHRYGKKRFANSLIDFEKVWQEPQHGKWKYWRMQWSLLGVGPLNPDFGVGGTYPGDSGAPYLGADEHQILVTPPGHQPRNVPVFTDRIIGVHTEGVNQVYGDGRFRKIAPGFPMWGVPMFPAYKQWIETECLNVPEPASIAALSLGSLVLLARRRRLQRRK